MRRENSRLPCVHHAVGDVEDDHEPGGKGSHRDLGEIAEAEQQQKQRKQRGGWRRAEEVDEKLHRAIDGRLGAKHDADWHTRDHRNQHRIRNAHQRVREVCGHLACGNAGGGVAQRIDRRRQQVLVDELSLERDPPGGDQQQRADGEFKRASDPGIAQRFGDGAHRHPRWTEPTSRHATIADPMRELFAQHCPNENAELCNASCKNAY